MRRFLEELYKTWISERPSQYAAALAYFSIFSFAPVIYAAYVVAGVFVRQISIAQINFEMVENTLGPEAANYLKNTVLSLANTTSSGSWLISLVGLLVLLYAASGLFFQLQFVLNKIFQAPLPTQGGTWRLVRQRLFAFLSVIGLGLFLALSTAVGILFSVFDRWFGPEWRLPGLDLVLNFVSVTLVFSLIYKFLPEVEMKWRNVWLGGLLAAALITIGEKLVSIFLAATRASSALEAASAFALILVSFYYAAMIFLLGAMFIRVYAGVSSLGASDRSAQSTSRGT
ncbi:MAG: YihY/virulence factor BrkB family protein [Anaerolineales bacterium]|nr:YihY/virulence factor BrkB family protein [Anaerolineales bacterium]